MKIDLSGKDRAGHRLDRRHRPRDRQGPRGRRRRSRGQWAGDRPRVDEAVAALAKEVPGAKVRGVAADVSTAVGCKELVAALPEVDILINNAGIFEPKDFFEIPDEDWSRFFEVNVMSGVRLSRAYLPAHAEAQLGSHRFHFLRIRAEHSDRDDPLRHDQDRAACDVARAWPS